jgi:isopentenyldiphosphate isomerase
MITSDELLDIVDEQDQVIGQMMRSQVYAKKMSNFRAVNVFIQNDKGQLWIPRRVATKRVFPLCLDASAAGHVASGETYEQAFVREVMEELAIDVTRVPWTYMGKTVPHQHNTSAFSEVYCIPSNEVPNYNSQDFFEYYWLTPQELIARIEAGDTSKGDLPKLVRLFFITT